MDALLKIKLAGELNEAVNTMMAETNSVQKIALAGKVQALLAQLGIINGDSEKRNTYADVLVKDLNRNILLVQRSLSDKFKPGKWWIPGGHVEKNETPTQAAIRELKEETGVKASIVKFLEKKSLPNDGVSHRFLVAVGSSQNVKLQKEELHDFAWVSIDNAKDYQLVGEYSDLQSLYEKSKKELALPDSPIPSERGKAAYNWLSDNLQNKVIKAVDGKEIYFNRNLSVDHLSHNARKSISEIIVKSIPHIAEVFETGTFVEREELTKNRTDNKVAFHIYKKWVEIDDKRVHLEAKACEMSDGKLVAKGDVIAYNIKALKQEILPSNLSQNMTTPYGGLAPAVDNDTPITDAAQAENEDYVLNILEITDLNGNPISLEDELQSVVNPEDFFNYNPKGVTKTQRQNANNAAIEIVRKVQTGELSIDDMTPEQKILLSTYSGSGGGLTTAEGTRGSSYEYYTPKPVAQGMWDLLKEMGFNGGRVLDPCAGTGIFSATAPQNALMESIELDKTSGTINRILFNDDNHKVTISPFEAVATATEDEIVDAVITNVPFGDNRGGNQFKDIRYQNENLESYFILRSLDKLRPNGLAVFMSGTSIMSGTRYRKIRQQISLKAEFMGAYRLPNKLFEDAGADVVTDVLVFKKHSRQNKAIIDELMQTLPETLRNANVLWETFISGHYFKDNPKFILGTETKVRSKYGEDVLAVMSDDSIGNIAKLLRRFDGSRINWELLNTVDSPIIRYQEGETLYFDGILKEYKNGAWKNVKTTETKANAIDKIYIELEQYRSPLVAIETKLDLARLLELVQQVKELGLDSMRIPQWVRDVMIAGQ